jgi:hypothetical protein
MLPTSILQMISSSGGGMMHLSHFDLARPLLISATLSSIPDYDSPSDSQGQEISGDDEETPPRHGEEAGSDIATGGRREKVYIRENLFHNFTRCAREDVDQRKKLM